MWLIFLIFVHPVWCELKCSRILTTEMEGVVSNGTLFAGDYEFTENLFEPFNDTFFRVCICEVRPCLRKCCPVGQVFRRLVCQDATNFRFRPKIFNESLSPISRNDTDAMYLATGVTCPKTLVTTDRVDVIWFHARPLDNGTLWLPNTTRANRRLFNSSDFCLENFVYHDGEIYGPAAFLCYLPATPSSYPKPFLVGILISIISLFLTFTVYAILPELQNLHGKSLMCHTFSLMLSFIALGSSRLGPKDYSTGSCITLGLTVAFSSLSAFFWLSVMGFDIWWTFSRYGYYKKSVLGDEKKTFILYSAYAWGSPALLLLFTLSIDWIPKKNLPAWFIRPQFGLIRCWYTDGAKLYYFFVPMALIVICNITFFGITAFNLVKAKRQTTILRKRRGTSNSSDRQQFGLYFKLFLVMGLNWMMEVIVQMVKIQNQSYGYFTYAANLFNTFQGAVIFVIFICKKRIKEQLWEKFGPMIYKEKTISDNNWRKSASLQVASSGIIFDGKWKPSKIN